MLFFLLIFSPTIHIPIDNNSAFLLQLNFNISTVRRNLTIPSQELSECLSLPSSGLKSIFEGKLDLVQYIFFNENI